MHFILMQNSNSSCMASGWKNQNILATNLYTYSYSYICLYSPVGKMCWCLHTYQVTFPQKPRTGEKPRNLIAYFVCIHGWPKYNKLNKSKNHPSTFVYYLLFKPDAHWHVPGCLKLFLCGCLYVCLCVCLPLIMRLLITSGMMWHDMGPMQLVKQVLQLLYGNCSHYG